MYTRKNSSYLRSEHIETRDLYNLSGDVHRGKASVVISSPGGAVDAVFVAQRLFQGREITTVGKGEVSSTALDIFILGSKRFATPDVNMLIHRVGYEDKGRTVRAREAFLLAEILRLDHRPLSADETLRDARLMLELDMYIARLISSRTRLETDRVMRLMDNEGTYLSLNEALEYGFVDDVVPSRLVEA